MYSFPMVSVTDKHKRGGSKRHMCYVEVQIWPQWANIKVLAGPPSFRKGFGGTSASLPSAVCRGPSHLRSQRAASPRLPRPLPLLRTLVIPSDPPGNPREGPQRRFCSDSLPLPCRVTYSEVLGTGTQACLGGCYSADYT